MNEIEQRLEARGVYHAIKTYSDQELEKYLATAAKSVQRWQSEVDKYQKMHDEAYSGYAKEGWQRLLFTAQAQHDYFATWRDAVQKELDRRNAHQATRV